MQKRISVSLFALVLTFSSAYSLTNPTYIAVGQQQVTSDKFMPSMFTSTDSGKSWQAIKLEGLSIYLGFLTKVTCMQNTCLAMGTEWDYYQNKPLLYISNDAGKHWQAKDTAYHPSSSIYVTDLACAEAHENSICTLVGVDSNYHAVIESSYDKGQTWVDETINNAPDKFLLNAVTCKINNTTPYCVAVGSVDDARSKQTLAFIVSKKNATEAWNIKTPAKSLTGIFKKVQCDNDAKSCIAFGANQNNQTPIIATTSDAGENWKVGNTGTLGEYIVLLDFACVENSFCVAVGKNRTTAEPVLGISRNYGWSWESKQIASPGSLNAVNCTQNVGKTQCLIAGYNAAHTFTVLNTDNGNTWQLNDKPGFPANVLVTNIQSFIQDGAITYLASGYDTTTQEAYISFSRDEGRNWLANKLPYGLIRSFTQAAT